VFYLVKHYDKEPPQHDPESPSCQQSSSVHRVQDIPLMRVYQNLQRGVTREIEAKGKVNTSVVLNTCIFHWTNYQYVLKGLNSKFPLQEEIDVDLLQV